MNNESEVCPCCEQPIQGTSRWTELLGKKLLVSQYDWIRGKASMGILKLHKRPES